MGFTPLLAYGVIRIQVKYLSIVPGDEGPKYRFRPFLETRLINNSDNSDDPSHSDNHDYSNSSYKFDRIGTIYACDRFDDLDFR